MWVSYRDLSVFSLLWRPRRLDRAFCVDSTCARFSVLNVWPSGKIHFLLFVVEGSCPQWKQGFQCAQDFLELCVLETRSVGETWRDGSTVASTLRTRLLCRNARDDGLVSEDSISSCEQDVVYAPPTRPKSDICWLKVPINNTPRSTTGRNHAKHSRCPTSKSRAR